jgi:hypothetical protein
VAHALCAFQGSTKPGDLGSLGRNGMAVSNLPNGAHDVRHRDANQHLPVVSFFTFNLRQIQKDEFFSKSGWIAPKRGNEPSAG